MKTDMKKRIDFRVHLPNWITRLFPEAVWVIPNQENKIFLTFDDGPDPEVTPAVLDILHKKNIKATFFCVGNNVTRYPELFDRIIFEGHAIGNHTFHHTQGIKHTKKEYYNDIEKANKIIGSTLFRPPHGIMSRAQYRKVVKHYHLIMWDVISCDYDAALTPSQCFNNVIDFVRSGSIITFHDSLKAEKNVLGSLPDVIDCLQEKGFVFERIDRIHNKTINNWPPISRWQKFKGNFYQNRKTA